MATNDETLTTPIVIDLGKTKTKRIKDLKKGKGKLVDEVNDVIEDVRARLGADATGKQLVPVVLIYRKRDKRGRGGIGLPTLRF